MHRLFDELEFRVLRDRLFATLSSTRAGGRAGFEVEGAALRPGTVGEWLYQHAAAARRRGGLLRRRRVGDRRVQAWRWPRRRRGCLHRRRRRRPRTTNARSAPGLADANRRKVGARRKGPLHAPALPRLALPDWYGHRTRRVSRPAGPAVVRVGRPRAALPAPGAALRGRRGRRAAVVARRRLRRRRRATSELVRARAVLRARRRAGRRARQPSARPRCWPTSSCRCSS